MLLRRFKMACDVTGATPTWSDVRTLTDHLAKVWLLDRGVAYVARGLIAVATITICFT